VLGFLILSYRETIKAYPTAGGAYMVTRDNFGLMPAQVAGVALLTDYVLTVAVSVAAGTAALVSAVSSLTPYAVPISVAFIILIAYGNLRGVKESGRIFAVPTYFFIVNMVVLLGIGLAKMAAGVEVYPGSVRYGEAVKDAGLHRAVVSSSANTRAVLKVTKLTDLFEVVVDGLTAERESLAGKPAPDMFAFAARCLDVAPAQAAVFEDALAGVEAGRAGGFGFVVGVDRTGQAEELQRHGADIVVSDLADLLAMTRKPS